MINSPKTIGENIMEKAAKLLRIGDIFSVGFVKFRVIEAELTLSEVRLLIQPANDKNAVYQQVTLYLDQVVKVKA
jgi:hypothetical protein